MLDTNIVSDLIRHPKGQAAARVAAHGEVGICVSIVTIAEVRFGLEKRRSKRLTEQAMAVLSEFAVVPFDVPADIEYGRLRADLEAAGTPIGANDLFIAAHALALRVVLATRNVSEFARVRGLAVENWLQ